MNLLENNHKSEETFDETNDEIYYETEEAEDDNAYNESVNGPDHRVDHRVDHRRNSFLADDKRMYFVIAFLSVVIIVMVFVIGFLLFQNKKLTDSSESIQNNIIEYLDESTENTDNEIQTSGDQNDETLNDLKEQNRDNTQTAKTDVDDAKDVNDLQQKLPAVETVIPSNVSLSEEEQDLIRTLPSEDESYTKEYILDEMLYHWEKGSTQAIYDLAALRRYRKLSFTLKGTDEYYYKGATNSEGLPIGKGLAIYADNTYYYGDFVNGKKEGEGIWYRFYFDTTKADAQNGLITSHSYVGSWKNDLPHGEGIEHFDVNYDMLLDAGKIKETIVATYDQGLYNGDIYCTTVEFPNNVQEWDGKVKNGVFYQWEDISTKNECFVWKNRADEKEYMKILLKDNVQCGFKEFVTER